MRWAQLLRGFLRRVPPGSGDFSQDLDKFLPGNRITFLGDGVEAFRSMWETIDSARKSVHLETYIFDSDSTGREFGRRLMEKARQGVSVRLIFDAAGSHYIDPGFLDQLRGAGVRVLEYHPLAPWRARWAWSRRDHRKILVVDGRTAFTGGMNISQDQVPREKGGRGWNDAHVRIEGPAVRELDRLFRAVWVKETKQWFPLEDAEQSRPGDSLAWVAANQEFLNRYRIRRAYLDALRAARREVAIANAYFLPGHGILRALAGAARRGVSVRLLVPGRSDHPAVWHAGRRTFDFLLRNGVRLFQWERSILHAKMAVVDGVWCTVGSYNMDHRSLRHNLEVNLLVLDTVLAAQMKKKFAGDLGSARELKLEEWRRRPRLDKLREEFWYQFRYFF
ncbi:MAG: phospholipase D-like domain-containing protein [Elusimicrobia bacterium]|nr:phospholipase D-like domain-containing protein [Elusimicrobiota bacterium]